jgi:hypothetical protein
LGASATDDLPGHGADSRSSIALPGLPSRFCFVLGNCYFVFRLPGPVSGLPALVDTASAGCRRKPPPRGPLRRAEAGASRQVPQMPGGGSLAPGSHPASHGTAIIATTPSNEGNHSDQLARRRNHRSGRRGHRGIPCCRGRNQRHHRTRCVAAQHSGVWFTGRDMKVALDQQRARDAVDVQEDQQVRAGPQGVLRTGVPGPGER